MDPARADRLPLRPPAPASVWPAPNVKDWSGPYLQKGAVPRDPWGNAYQYRFPGQHNASGYDLYSFGPDGQDGGGDDIDNWTQK